MTAGKKRLSASAAPSAFSERASFRRRLPLRAKICLLVITGYALAAGWGEIVHYRSKTMDVTPVYNLVNLEYRNMPPMTVVPGSADAGGRRAYLGTDSLGRDVMLRLVQGTRIAFHVGIITSCLAIPFGALLGLFAGYYRGKTDALICALAAVTAAVPSVLFILAVALVVGKGLVGIYLGISLTTWVGVFRTVRGETMKHRERGYVQAARALGYSDMRIMFRHILPNVLHVIIIAFSVRFPSAVGTEVFMSFLGIGVQGEPSWGIMINNARVRLWQGVWWEAAAVTLAVFGLVFSFNLLGDALRDTLDPSLD